MPEMIEEYFVEGLRNSLNKIKSINGQMDSYLNQLTNKMLFHIEDVSYSNRSNINKYKLEEYLEIEFKNKIKKIFTKKITEIAENLSNGYNKLKNEVINTPKEINKIATRNEDIHAKLRITSRINLDNLDIFNELKYSNSISEETLYEVKSFINKIIEEIETEINESLSMVIRNSYYYCDEFINKHQKENETEDEVEYLEVNDKEITLAKIIDINGDKKELIMEDGSIITIDEFNKKIIPLVDENNMINVQGIGPMNIYDYLNEVIIPLEKLQKLEPLEENKQQKSTFR